MPDLPPKPPPSLAELRREIDRIDEAMHALLLDRGEIIESLIAIKRAQGGGSAFRPARETEMMQRLVGRHRGILPLDTAESIWRVIIATFTYVQAPYSVHADLSPGEAAMRDVARFHFGFTAPFVPHVGPQGALAAVAAAAGDLALVPAEAVAAGQAWWSALEPPEAPKIIARLPFVERPGHPAGFPTFVLARPIPDAMVPDVEVWSVRVSGWNAATARALPTSGMIALPDRAFDGAALLVSLPRDTIERTLAALRDAGASVRSAALVGSHAKRYTLAEAHPAGPPA